jgi:hypothetical protein
MIEHRPLLPASQQGQSSCGSPCTTEGSLLRHLAVHNKLEPLVAPRPEYNLTAFLPVGIRRVLSKPSVRQGLSRVVGCGRGPQHHGFFPREGPGDDAFTPLLRHYREAAPTPTDPRQRPPRGAGAFTAPASPPATEPPCMTDGLVNTRVWQDRVCLCQLPPCPKSTGDSKVTLSICKPTCLPNAGPSERVPRAKFRALKTRCSRYL